ncbi:MAG: hypothetical protein FJ161_01715 [Gammaproteobacteria bacterium]|nr:hypothetical protein [Gammaproteobacteria bacterium]
MESVLSKITRNIHNLYIGIVTGSWINVFFDPPYEGTSYQRKPPQSGELSVMAGAVIIIAGFAFAGPVAIGMFAFGGITAIHGLHKLLSSDHESSVMRALLALVRIPMALLSGNWFIELQNKFLPYPFGKSDPLPVKIQRTISSCMLGGIGFGVVGLGLVSGVWSLAVLAISTPVLLRGLFLASSTYDNYRDRKLTKNNEHQESQNKSSKKAKSKENNNNYNSSK